ncbi:MAG: hypothetical protein FJW31_28515 [Acidobacteria bacterium]|nr:hypothetical protein [Acidobacteriota bacterium]
MSVGVILAVAAAIGGGALFASARGKQAESMNARLSKERRESSGALGEQTARAGLAGFDVALATISDRPEDHAAPVVLDFHAIANGGAESAGQGWQIALEPALEALGDRRFESFTSGMLELEEGRGHLRRMRDLDGGDRARAFRVNGFHFRQQGSQAESGCVVSHQVAFFARDAAGGLQNAAKSERQVDVFVPGSIAIAKPPSPAGLKSGIGWVLTQARRPSRRRSGSLAEESAKHATLVHCALAKLPSARFCDSQKRF